MDRLDDHSQTKWDIQLAKFESKILNANRGRDPARAARVSGASPVYRGKVGKLRSWTDSGTE